MFSGSEKESWSRHDALCPIRMLLRQSRSLTGMFPQLTKKQMVTTHLSSLLRVKSSFQSGCRQITGLRLAQAIARLLALITCHGSIGYITAQSQVHLCPFLLPLLPTKQMHFSKTFLLLSGLVLQSHFLPCCTENLQSEKTQELNINE